MSSASLRSLLAKWTSGLLIRSGAVAVGTLLLALPPRAAVHSPGSIGQIDEHGKPQVSVVTPADCPLLISGVDDSLLTAPDFELSFSVLNIGARPITWYTVRFSQYRGQSPAGSGDTTSYWGVIGPSTFNFAPGQWKEEVLSAGGPKAVDRVELAVDFVEFADRTTWGPDLDRSGQMLSGMRSGARIAQAYLKNSLEARGSFGLATVVSPEHLLLEPYENNEPSEKNDDWRQWTRGYRLGRDTIQRRVKQALESGRVEAAAAVLNQPI
jgi:hypothetical protein